MGDRLRQQRKLGLLVMACIAPFVARWWGSNTKSPIIQYSASSTRTKTTNHTFSASKADVIDIEEWLDAMNASAHRMYPDQFPDCLYLLQQADGGDAATDRITYQLVQSMNTYWKHHVSFRRVQLKINLDLLQGVAQLLSSHGVTKEWLEHGEDLHEYPFGFLHKRIYESGGQLPIMANWKVLKTDNTTSHCSFKASDPPVFQGYLPTACPIDHDYWLIPTAPLVRQVHPHSRFSIPRNITREGIRQAWLAKRSAIAVADTAEQVVEGEYDRIREPLESILSRETWHFFNPIEIKAKGQEIMPERTDLAKGFQFVLDFSPSITNVLYPSLLCGGNVLLLPEPRLWKDWSAVSLQPNIHYLSVNWDDLNSSIHQVLNPENVDRMSEMFCNALEWCQTHMTRHTMTVSIVQSVVEYVRRLDGGNVHWVQVWKDRQGEYLQGHWFHKPGGDSWTLPISIVGQIKAVGIRADDPCAHELMRQHDEEQTKAKKKGRGGKL